MNDSFRVKKTINFKAILIVVGALAALVVGVHFLHAFQVKRNAAGLLQEAKLMQDENKLNEARQYLKQYVGMVPDDVEALAQYGLLLEKSAEKINKRAAWIAPYDIYARVLFKEPDRQDILRRQARLAIRLVRFNAAKDYLTTLLKTQPEDPELNQLMARCVWLGDNNHEEADRLYRKALSRSKDPDLFLEFAQHLHDQKDAVGAAAQVEDMIRLNKDSLSALIKAADFYMMYREWEPAQKHLEFAIDTLKARDVNVYVLAESLAREQKDYAKALAYVEKGLTVLPGHPALTGDKAVLLTLTHQDTQAKKLVNELINAAKAGPKKIEAANIEAAKIEPKQPAEPPIKLDNPRALFNLADVLIELKEMDKAREKIREFEEKGDQFRTPAMFLKARLAHKEHNWALARKHLEELLQRRDSAMLAVHANLILADCYDKLGNRDKQLEACMNAKNKAPKNTDALKAYAGCLAAMGKYDEAIKYYRQMAEEAIPVPGARLELARLLFIQTQRQPPGEQDWTVVEQELARIQPKDPGEVAVKLLHADVLLAQRKYDEARKIAEEMRDRDPREIAPWMFLVNMANIQGDPEAAGRLLDEAEKKTDKHAEWTLARFRLLVQMRRTEQLKQLLPRIEAGLKEFPEAEQNKLLFGLADSYVLVGERKKAEELWATVAERLPDDIHVRFRLFESAFQERHEANAQKWLAELQKVEGPDGAAGLYGKAALLVLRYYNSGEKDSAALEQTAPLLRELNRLRPSWSRIALLEGTILEAQGQQDKALDKFKLARQRGEMRPSVTRHIVWLLHQRGRLAEAEAVMRELPEEALTSPEMRRMASNIMLLAHPEGNQQEARARALEMARKAVQDQKAEFGDYIWLGLLAAAAEQPAEAEKALRKAREMKPEIAGTWTPLIGLLARTDPGKAELELRRAEKELPREQAVLVLAAGYEALGKDKLAEESYETALKIQPNDVNLLRNASGFYRRIGQPVKAEAALRNILDPATKAPEAVKAWANRNLALTLVSRGGYANFQKAVALLEANVALIGDTDEDRRAKALVLATQPSHRTEAIKLFENLSHNQKPTPETQFFLAQLYEADGHWFKARPLLITLIQSQPNNAVYQMRLIAMLLRNKQASEALPFVERLAKLKPNQPETVVLEVRVLKELGREREARDKVHSYQNTSNPSLEIVGHLFEDLGMKLEAEQAFRANAEAAKDQKDQIKNLTYALFLGRVGKTETALSICEQAWKTCPPGAVAATAVSVLRGGQVAENLQREAIRQIEAAIRQHPEQIELRYFLAECHDVLGHLDEAIAGYRDVLKVKEGHVPALNNLAAALALKEGKGSNALQLINKALEITGPIAELLDTRAMVYLSDDQPRPAMVDLKEAIRLNPKPLYFFHLARAYHMTQERFAALDYMDKAVKGGLKTSALPRLEQPVFENLHRELKGS